MTDTAPPARTPLTPEERMLDYVHSAHCMDSGVCMSCRDKLSRSIRAAETAARSEGRLAGLEEAAVIVEQRQVSGWVPHGAGPAFAQLAQRIRGLAEDVPKAPKTPSDPDPR